VAIPGFEPEGFLPSGIHAAALTEVRARFGTASADRQRQGELLAQIVEAAKGYPTIKRILVWGSFVTAKADPNDLDYSVIVSVNHYQAPIARAHRRFFVPADARRYYGADRNYLVIPDYPLPYYIEKLEFACHARDRRACGVVEISLRGEMMGDAT
jgi:hypothetical protein